MNAKVFSKIQMVYRKNTAGQKLKSKRLDISEFKNILSPFLCQNKWLIFLQFIKHDKVYPRITVTKLTL